MADEGGETYEAAGVSIGAGEAAVEAIKADVRSTFRPEVIGDIGGFGGLFRFDPSRYRDPVLVSSTDGVGTKSQVATAVGRFDTIGIDLVAMCVDDLVCAGAEPLFFLDYISVGSLDPGPREAAGGGRGRGLPPGRVCARRRRDGRAPRHHGLGRVRPGRVRRRCGRARPDDHRRPGGRGGRAHRIAVAGSALERLLAGAAADVRRRRPLRGRPGLERPPRSVGGRWSSWSRRSSTHRPSAR